MMANTYRYRYMDPSCYRRKALLLALSSMGGEDSSFPITRFYESAVKVLAAFGEAFGEQDWDSAFVYGNFYCSSCIESIPQHKHYLASKLLTIEPNISGTPKLS